MKIPWHNQEMEFTIDLEIVGIMHETTYGAQRNDYNPVNGIYISNDTI